MPELLPLRSSCATLRSMRNTAPATTAAALTLALSLFVAKFTP